MSRRSENDALPVLDFMYQCCSNWGTLGLGALPVAYPKRIRAMSSSGDVSRATWARRQRACARVTSPLAFFRAFARETLAQFARTQRSSVAACPPSFLVHVGTASRKS